MPKKVAIKPHRVNRSLKFAVRRLTKAIGTKRAAHALGLSEARVSRFGNPNFHDEITAQNVMLLEGIAGDLIVTGFMAHSNGAALLKLPREASHRGIHSGFTRSAKHMALLFAAYPESPAQAGAALKECDDALSALSDLRAILARTA